MTQVAETLGDHGARIHNLETDAKEAREEYRADIVKVFEYLKELRDGQIELKTMVTERAATPCEAIKANKELEKRVVTLDEQMDSLRGWRNVIVGGSLVAWFFICVAAYMFWDWVKSKVFGMQVS